MNKKIRKCEVLLFFWFFRNCELIRDSSLWRSNFIPLVHDSIIIIGSISVTYTFGSHFACKRWIMVFYQNLNFSFHGQVFQYFLLGLKACLLRFASHCVVPTSHVTVLLSYLAVSLFFLIFNGTILTLYNTNIACECTFLIFGGSLIFSLTFDGIIFIFCSTKITCDCTFVTFNGSHFFFSHLMVSSSYYALQTSYVIVLLSHSMVALFFSHIWWYCPHIVQYQQHMWL